MKSLLNLISKRNDVILAILLVSIIFMMIIPMPTIIVDSLVALNIVISASLLMLSIYISSPLQISSFPSILLITTIFRLALSITTTRLILLNGDAGSIIDVFGNFVVRGNLIVGIVIFLIITIVQFIVITKGSERVAEVAARFSLDAMPGKQMSIDSDLRAGMMDAEEAKRKRSNVQQESQLYGSMDGAMKFVKGDSIAGLVIISVNLIGGVLIGIFQLNMTFSEAIGLYTILTIGDGLISQIPGLFISITAGIVVTRVASDNESNLGNKIAFQVTSHPSAIFITSGICILFAIIPGMPYMIFLFLGGILFAGGIFLVKNKKNRKEYSESSENIENLEVGLHNSTKLSFNFSKKIEIKGRDYSPVIPCMVQISTMAMKIIDSYNLEAFLESKKNEIYMETGVPFPSVGIKVINSNDAFVDFLIYEKPEARMYVYPNKCIIDKRFESSSFYTEKIEGIFNSSIDYHYINKNDLTASHASGFVEVKYSSAIAECISNLMIANQSLFIGIQESYELLERSRKHFSELINEVYKILTIQKISTIFKRLSSENISIRNIRDILEGMVEAGQKERDPVMLTEYIRGHISNDILHKLANNNSIDAYIIDVSLEKMISENIRYTSTGSYLGLNPREVSDISNIISNNVQSDTPVIITSMEIRRFLKKILSKQLPNANVISFQEINEKFSINPISTIGEGMIATS